MSTGWSLWVGQQGGEGNILKERRAPYRPGLRSPAWLKVKHRLTLPVHELGGSPDLLTKPCGRGQERAFSLPRVSTVKMSARVTLRVGLRQGRPLREPQIRASGSRPSRGAEFATTAHGPDLVLSAQQAVRYLVAERELTREETYAADLRISEIVDAPNWIVSASSRSIFG
jgi:hypothetical protein